MYYILGLIKSETAACETATNKGILKELDMKFIVLTVASCLLSGGCSSLSLSKGQLV